MSYDQRCTTGQPSSNRGNVSKGSRPRTKLNRAFFPLIVKKDLSVKDNAVKKLYSSYFVIFCDATNLNKSHQTKYATNRQQLTKAVSNVNVIFDRHISTKFQNIEYNLEADIVKITRLHQKLHGGWSKFLEVGCG